MRPSGVTAVASTVSNAAPESARLPRCIRCQSVMHPSTAEYWHIGAMMIRSTSSSSPTRSGLNRVLILITWCGRSANHSCLLGGLKRTLPGELSPELDALASVEPGVHRILARAQHRKCQTHERTRAMVGVERCARECEPPLDQHLDCCGEWRPESEQQENAIGSSCKCQWNAAHEFVGHKEQGSGCCDSQQQEATPW